MSNSFGTLFKITTFGESHGPALGVILDGCPAGLVIDEVFIQSELERRKPGQSKITTQRKEDDSFKILSGVFEGKSTGTPISIDAYVAQVGEIEAPHYTQLDLSKTEDNIVRCPDADTAEKMIALIDQVRLDRDTIGGTVMCIIKNTPVGLGEPVFDKLHAELGKAMLSINAVKGFEYGSGFDGVKMRGSEHNDAFYVEGGKVKTKTNHSGGIQGGISNGEDIYFRVAFKPVATIMQDQDSIDKHGNAATVSGKGRHDPCVVPRAVPIVEAMAALVLADMVLRAKSSKIEH
jgi:chorismate synthase